MLQYSLRRTAFLCSAPRHWVFLDVKKDQYLCLNKEDLEPLSPWLEGWPHTKLKSHHTEEAPVEVRALTRELLEREIICEPSGDSKPVKPTCWRMPEAGFEPVNQGSKWAVRAKYAPAFFAACHKANVSLGAESLQSILATVEERKRRYSLRGASLNWQLSAALLTAFDSLRLFYPRSYLCLFDSYALIEFMSRYGLFPTWVFAVVAEPFEAHCWVQHEGVVLNDTVANVSRFTPIMCI